MTTGPRRRAGWWVLLWSLTVAVVFAADVRVTPLVTDGQVFASFSADDSYTSEVREAVQSGLPTALTFTVELRQAAVVWFDHTVNTVTVESRIKFDNLTRTFQVSRMIDGQIASSESTTKEDDVKKWATQFDRVSLSKGENLEPNGEYYVRVRMRTSPRRSFSLWPWGRDDAAGRADFTFIK